MAGKNVSEFIAWTWDMVNGGHSEIGWSEDGSLVVVANAERLAEHVLPKYFRHGQYASWVRALNAYDFKKSGAGRWWHPSFLRGQPDLLANIRRKPPPARGATAAAASTMSATAAAASSTSTALVPRRKRAPTSPDVEARQQLWWMQQEIARLTGEVGAIKSEEFQQRFDTVRLMQVMLAHLTQAKHAGGARRTARACPSARPPARPRPAPLVPPSPLSRCTAPVDAPALIRTLVASRVAEAKIVLNPAVISSHAGAAQLTYKEDVGSASSSASGGGSSSDGSGGGSSSADPDDGRGGGGGGGSGSALPFFDLPPIRPQRSEGDSSIASLPSLHAGGNKSFDIPSLELDLNGALGQPLSAAPSFFGSAPPAAQTRTPSSPPVVDTDAMLRIDEEGGALLEDGYEAVSTSGVVASASAAGEHSTQMVPAVAANAAAANIIGALANSAASTTALHFANVLARMPPLPASTAQLPPRGSVQRQHIEAAIELAFRQLSITASQALASQQQT
jgi:uncharacterized membrane protein YgcG